MNALAFMDCLREKRAIPWSTEDPTNATPDGMTSRSEVKRWLRMGAVTIDGTKVGIDTEIHFPVSDVVFFSNGAKRTTMGPFELCEIEDCGKCLEKQGADHGILV